MGSGAAYNNRVGNATKKYNDLVEQYGPDLAPFVYNGEELGGIRRVDGVTFFDVGANKLGYIRVLLDDPEDYDSDILAIEVLATSRDDYGTIYTVDDDPAIISAIERGNPSNEFIETDQVIRVADVICEGPIEGFAKYDPLKGIYVNETPFKDVRNNLAFSIYEPFHFRWGYPVQSPVDALPLISTALTGSNLGTELTDSVESKAANETKDFNLATSADSASFDLINASDYDHVIFTLRTNRLFKYDDQGNLHNLRIAFMIRVVNLSNGGNAWIVGDGSLRYDDARQISGKTLSPVAKDIKLNSSLWSEVPVENSQTLRFTIYRCHPIDPPGDSRTGLVDDGKAAHDFLIENPFGETTLKMQYPHTAYIAGGYSAKESGNQIPRRAFHLRLKKVPLPVGYDGYNRRWTSTPWNGNFKSLTLQGGDEIYDLEYTDNPAWVFNDLLTNKRFGLGRYTPYNLADKWNIAEIATWCDEQVYTGKYLFQQIIGTQNTISGNNYWVPVDALKEDWPHYLGHDFDLDSIATYEGRRLRIMRDDGTGGGIFVAFCQVVNRAKVGTNWIAIEADRALGDLAASSHWIEGFHWDHRFSCNAYITTREQALKVLSDFTSVFLGMQYWQGGNLLLSADKSDLADNVAMVFTNANVSDDGFVYESTSKTARHTVALVRWNDPLDYFRPKFTLVEYTPGLLQYGENQTEIQAFGCTSEAQARRVGKYALITEFYEDETIAFVTTLRAGVLSPGMIIQIRDQSRTSKRLGGRFISIASSSNNHVVTLDREVEIYPSAEYTYKLVRSGFKEDPQDSSKQVPTIEKLDVLTAPASNPTNYTELTLDGEYDETAFGEVKANDPWVLERYNVDQSADLIPQFGRVLNVEQIDDEHTYKVLALNYEPTKWDEIDGVGEVEPTPYSDLLSPLGEFPELSNLTMTVQKRSNGGNVDGTLYSLRMNWEVETASAKRQIVSSFDVEFRTDSGKWQTVNPQRVTDTGAEVVIEGYNSQDVFNIVADFRVRCIGVLQDRRSPWYYSQYYAPFKNPNILGLEVVDVFVDTARTNDNEVFTFFSGDNVDLAWSVVSTTSQKLSTAETRQLASGYRILVTKDDGEQLGEIITTTNDTVYSFVRGSDIWNRIFSPFNTSATVIFTVFVRDADGNESNFSDSATLLVPIPSPITGLELKDQGNNNVFTTRDAIFVWRLNSEYAGSHELGSEPSGDSGRPQPYMKGYEIEIYNEDGSLRRTDIDIVDPQYEYFFEKNYEDGLRNTGAAVNNDPSRTFTIFVYAVNIYGQRSKPAQLLVTNPVPTLPFDPDDGESLQVDNYVINFKYSQPTAEADWEGLSVYWNELAVDAEAPTTIEASDANLVFRGRDSNFSVFSTIGGDGNFEGNKHVYFRFVTRDSFGEDADALAANTMVYGPYVIVPPIDITPPADVTNFSLTTEERENAAGKTRVYVLASWTAPIDSDLRGYELSIGKTASLSTTTTKLEILAPTINYEWEVDPNIDYTVSIRSFDENGNYSENFVLDTIASSPDTTVPAQPSSLSLVKGIRSVLVRWDLYTETDIAQVQVYRHTSDSFAGASLIGTVLGDRYVDDSLPAYDPDNVVVYYYWVRFVDSSGNVSSESSSVSTNSQNTVVAEEIESLFVSQLIGGEIIAQEIVLVTDGSDSVVRSSNFSTEVAGWNISSDGTAEFNSLSARADIRGGSLHIYSTTSNPTNIGFHVDSTGQLWAGGPESDPAAAPFRVESNGTVTVTGKVNINAASALSAALTISTGNIIIDGNSAAISLGKSAYADSTAGAWIGKVGGNAAVNIGNATKFIQFDTSGDLLIQGQVNINSTSTVSAAINLSGDNAAIRNNKTSPNDLSNQGFYLGQYNDSGEYTGIAMGVSGGADTFLKYNTKDGVLQISNSFFYDNEIYIHDGASFGASAQNRFWVGKLDTPGGYNDVYALAVPFIQLSRLDEATGQTDGKGGSISIQGGIKSTGPTVYYDGVVLAHSGMDFAITSTNADESALIGLGVEDNSVVMNARDGGIDSGSAVLLAEYNASNKQILMQTTNALLGGNLRSTSFVMSGVDGTNPNVAFRSDKGTVFCQVDIAQDAFLVTQHSGSASITGSVGRRVSVPATSGLGTANGYRDGDWAVDRSGGYYYEFSESSNNWQRAVLTFTTW